MNKIAFHLCISGFTQDVSTTHGICTLSEKLIQASHSCQVNSRVWLRKWSENWSAIAESIELTRRHYEADVIVNVYAYSWGAGWGAMQLAKYLQKPGIHINSMVLCDPVYRHPWFILRWLSLLSRDWTNFSPVIKMPSNVDKVDGYFQVQDRPQGHRVVRARGNTTTKINHFKPLKRSHQYMDDAREFHDLCLHEASKVKTILNEEEQCTSEA